MQKQSKTKQKQNKTHKKRTETTNNKNQNNNKSKNKIKNKIKNQWKKKEKNKTENQKTKYDIIRKTFINSCYWSNLSNFNLVQLLSVHNIKKLNNLRKCQFFLRKIFFRYLLYNARLCLYCCVYVNIIKYYTQFVYLQLTMQSVPITTKVWGLNPARGEVCSIQHYVIKFVSDLRQVGGFLRALRFPRLIKLTATI